MVGKKKKTAPAPAGITRGVATTSTQKKPGPADNKKPEPDPGIVAKKQPLKQNIGKEPPPEPPKKLGTPTRPGKGGQTGTEDQEEQLAREASSRVAALKVETEYGKDEKRRAAVAEDASIPTLKLSELAQTQIWKSVQLQQLASKFDWFGAEVEEETSQNRLLITYLTLEKLGFSPDNIEKAMKAAGGQNLTSIFDWLSLTVPLEELPEAFRDNAALGEETTVKLARAAAVKPKPLAPPPRARTPPIRCPPIEPTTAEEKKAIQSYLVDAAETWTSPEDRDMKAWILKQARTWDEPDEPDAESQPETVRLSPSELYAKSYMDSEEYRQLAADAKARNDKEQQRHYETAMRTAKQDMALAQSEKKFDFGHARKLIDQAVRAKGPVEKKPAEKAPPEKAAPPTPSVDAEDDMDLLSKLFDETETKSEEGEIKFNAKAPPRVLDLSINNWTGKTPRQYLQQWIAKNIKGAKVRYNVIKEDRYGFRVGVKFPGATGKAVNEKTRFEMDANDRCQNVREGEEYAATKALYTLAAGLSLHRNFPPPYRDLWKEWVDAIENAAKTQVNASDDRRLNFIRRFVEFREARAKRYLEKRQASQAGAQEEIEKAAQSDHMYTQLDPQQNKKKMQQRTSMAAYKKLQAQRMSLPVHQMKREILEVISKHRVVVVSGETGSGKSTQIPQFLVEDAIANGDAKCRVVCTQPRRISAISIASRVSEEMGDVPGRVGGNDSWVGYQVRLENRVGKQTMLTFCTLGILMKRLEGDKRLQHVTHVVLDEVHERSLDSDFLILILKRLLAIRSDLRIILMSATGDADRFSSYFERIPGVGHVPCLHVPGRTFPVQAFFLEDAIEATGFVVENGLREKTKDVGSVTISGKGGSKHTVRLQYDEAAIRNQAPTQQNATIKMASRPGPTDVEDDDDDEDEEASDFAPDLTQSSPTKNVTYSPETLHALSLLDRRRTNFDLLEQLITHICQQDQERSVQDHGSILVFLPGIAEIKIMMDRLAGVKDMWTLGLHSSMGTKDQAKVFQKAPPGQRKIVFSTNIAETGITIPDVTVVIDTMRAREIQLDTKRNLTKLKEVLISRANALQRRGRAGRVQEGVCWHLVDGDQWGRVAHHRPPEMVRVPLEEVCLRVRTCGFEGTVAEVLDGCVDAPPEKNVDRAVNKLKMIQAFTSDEKLTPMGRKLSNLPLDTGLGKMLLTSVALRCLDPVLTICAAISSGKSMFLSGSTGEVWRPFLWGLSDLMMTAKAFEAYRAVNGPMGIRRRWCENRDLSLEVMVAVDELRGQLLKALLDCNVISIDRTSEAVKQQRSEGKNAVFALLEAAYSENAAEEEIVAAALASGAWPSLFVMDPPPLALGQVDVAPVTVHIPGESLPYRLHKSSPLVKALGVNRVKELGKEGWCVAYGVRGSDAGSVLSCWDLTRVSGLATWCLCGIGVEAQHRHGTIQFASPTSQPLSLIARSSPRIASAVSVYGSIVREALRKRMIGMTADEQEEKLFMHFLSVLRRETLLQG